MVLCNIWKHSKQSRYSTHSLNLGPMQDVFVPVERKFSVVYVLFSAIPDAIEITFQNLYVNLVSNYIYFKFFSIFLNLCQFQYLLVHSRCFYDTILFSNFNINALMLFLHNFRSILVIILFHVWLCFFTVTMFYYVNVYVPCLGKLLSITKSIDVIARHEVLKSQFLYKAQVVL